MGEETRKLTEDIVDIGELIIVALIPSFKKLDYLTNR